MKAFWNLHCNHQCVSRLHSHCTVTMKGSAFQPSMGVSPAQSLDSYNEGLMGYMDSGPEIEVSSVHGVVTHT